MKISDHVKGTSKFIYYRSGNLYYKTDTGIEFFIPIDDTNEATFLDEDKSIFFMRWIRKYFEAIS